MRKGGMNRTDGEEKKRKEKKRKEKVGKGYQTNQIKSNQGEDTHTAREEKTPKVTLAVYSTHTNRRMLASQGGVSCLELDSGTDRAPMATLTVTYYTHSLTHALTHSLTRTLPSAFLSTLLFQGNSGWCGNIPLSSKYNQLPPIEP